MILYVRVPFRCVLFNSVDHYYTNSISTRMTCNINVLNQFLLFGVLTCRDFDPDSRDIHCSFRTL